MIEKKAKLSRRNFLLTVGVSSAAATTAAIVGKQPGTNLEQSKDKRATAGYQASEHINNYYRTTKV